MDATLYSWGAAGEVTGSKHFLELGTKTLMVDCGAFQGRRAESDRKNRAWPFEADGVDGVILTHAHFDHCGLLPLLPRKGFSGNIHTTPASRDLASLVMMDSAHIQARDMEFLAKRAKRKGEHFAGTPLYDERDVVRVLDYFVTVSYQRPFRPLDGVQATFFDAGHILGSAMAFVEADGLSIGFSGDLGRPGLPILRDPAQLPAVDYLVLESTYGDRLHDPIAKAKDQLEKVVQRTIKRGGKIIIPAFAVERTQELIYFLHELRREERIPEIPIFVDSPMATNATSIFRVHQECYDATAREEFLANHENPFGFNDLHYVSSVSESKKLNDLREPAILIASSGMCEAGRILHHLKNNAPDRKNTILIVGFMANHTLGRRILERQAKIKVFGDMYELNAEVVALNTFSGHADYEDLMGFVSGQDPARLKEIFLVHGEPDAQANLKRLLEEQGFRATIVAYEERYTLRGR